MALSYSLPTPLEYFAALVQSDEQFPLLEAAACIAHDEYPEFDVQQLLGDMDQLLARVRRRLPEDASSLQRLRSLNQFFFHDLGFGGNVNNYYDPDNSYLNAVLRTRRGIPISLAVLWMELAQGLGLHARGISFPGHFMVKVLLPRGQVVLDPTTGQSLSREDLAERLEPSGGAAAWWTISKFPWGSTCRPPERGRKGGLITWPRPWRVRIAVHAVIHQQVAGQHLAEHALAARAGPGDRLGRLGTAHVHHVRIGAPARSAMARRGWRPRPPPWAGGPADGPRGR